MFTKRFDKFAPLAENADMLDTLNVPVAEVRRILVLRASAMGDVVHTVPALAALRTVFPDAEIDWLIALTGAVRTAKTELGIAPGAKLEAFCPAPGELAKSVVEANAAAIERLARLTPIHFAEAPDGAAMQVAAGEDAFVIPLEGIIDIAAEKARLEKALEASAKEAKSLEGRLSNANFGERAKPDAVEKARADHAHHTAEVARLEAALARLG